MVWRGLDACGLLVAPCFIRGCFNGLSPSLLGLLE
uniref:Uncharacterized protein n=1 Tax=Rhizophora mucronata TaxID=61149 RepID=A0A2P2PMR1_RHIMU